LPRLPIAGCAQFNGFVIKLIHSFFGSRRDGHHVAIARMIGLTIERCAHRQHGLGHALTNERNALHIQQHLAAQLPQQIAVELLGFAHVTDTDGYVSDHACSPWLVEVQYTSLSAVQSSGNHSSVFAGALLWLFV
jgi:hypothetical protein